MSQRDNSSTSQGILPNPKVMNLKKQLRLHLEHNDMTAAQLARKAGVPKQSISGWLAGNNPRDVRQVKKVADVFETTVDVLIFGSGLEISEQLKEKNVEDLLGDEWIGGIFEVRLRRVKK